MQYRVIETIVTDADGHRHRTYGISVSETRIEDISFDRRQVIKLTRLFNKMKLDAVHFQCAVEDYLLKNCNLI